jgi:hypothetical protein
VARVTIIFMKSILFICATALVLSSCCKAYCIQEPQLTVTFQNFRTKDVDSVYLFRYSPGSSQYSDSTAYIEPSWSQDTSYARMNLVLVPDYNWKIRVGSLTREFQVTDLQTETGDCQCGSGTYRIVNSYRLDGQEKEGSLLFLR